MDGPLLTQMKANPVATSNRAPAMRNHTQMSKATMKTVCIMISGSRTVRTQINRASPKIQVALMNRSIKRMGHTQSSKAALRIKGIQIKASSKIQVALTNRMGHTQRNKAALTIKGIQKAALKMKGIQIKEAMMLNHISLMTGGTLMVEAIKLLAILRPLGGRHRRRRRHRRDQGAEHHVVPILIGVLHDRVMKTTIIINRRRPDDLRSVPSGEVEETMTMAAMGVQA
jgi:hypothetical protein